MNYDPYSGRQIRFERTDPTGRWSPIEPFMEARRIAWLPWAGGAVMGVVFAVMFFLAV